MPALSTFGFTRLSHFDVSCLNTMTNSLSLITSKSNQIYPAASLDPGRKKPVPVLEILNFSLGKLVVFGASIYYV